MSIMIQSGQYIVGSTGHPDWNLYPPATGSPRSSQYRIAFQNPFKSSPHINLGITALDTQNNGGNNGVNTRVKVTATKIDNEGFSILFETWSDSSVWGISVDWLAYTND